MATKQIKLGLCLVLAGSAVTALAQGKFAGVEALLSGKGHRVVISGDNLDKPKLTLAKDGTSVVLDFYATLENKPDKINVNKLGLDSIQYARYSSRPPRVRVVVRTTPGTKSNLEFVDKGWVLHVGQTADTMSTNVLAEFGSPNYRQPMRPGNAKLEPVSQSRAPIARSLTPPEQLFASMTSPSVPEAKLASPGIEQILLSTAPSALDGTPVQPRVSQGKKPSTKTGRAAAKTSSAQSSTTKAGNARKVANAAASGSVSAQQQAPEAQKSVSGGPASDPELISMDFQNTDVAQILKALAIQAGVSIVTGPELNAKEKPIQISVTLDRVTVTEALDLVTTVAGLQYAKVGRAFVVTTREKFNETMKNLGGSAMSTGLRATRVVPIYSGQAPTIRASVLASMTAEIGRGNFDILLPSDQFKLTEETAPKAGEDAGTNVGVEASKTQDSKDAGTPAANSKSGKSNASFRGMKEQYLVLVGPEPSAEYVEARIRELDALVLKANGREIPTSSKLVRQTYTVRSEGVPAGELVNAIAGVIGSDLLSVDLYPSPAGFLNQTIVVVGRDTEVQHAIEVLTEIDAAGYGDEMQIYDVKFSDPRALRESLMAAVPGLRVSIPPASAGNVKLYKPGAAKKAENEGKLGDTGDPGATKDQKMTVGGETGKVAGLSQPFQEFESAAVPMRLILKGTQGQIAEATKYLVMVDTAPRQVALELRVAQLSKEDAVRLGIDWNLFTGGAVKLIRLNNGQPNPSNTVGININGKNIAGDVSAMLDATLDKSNIIARPNMLAMDGRETELFIGDVVRYIESITNSQNGPSITTGEVRVGVRLAVLPRVGGDGSITMDLRPVVSFLRGFIDVPGGGKLPQTSERIAQSTINILNGETIAIGGLIQEQDSRQESGIPILKDLPIIGQLFKRSTNTKSRSEVVFFLTARSIEGPATANNAKVLIPPQGNEGKNGGK